MKKLALIAMLPMLALLATPAAYADKEVCKTVRVTLIIEVWVKITVVTEVTVTIKQGELSGSAPIHYDYETNCAAEINGNITASAPPESTWALSPPNPIETIPGAGSGGGDVTLTVSVPSMSAAAAGTYNGEVVLCITAV